MKAVTVIATLAIAMGCTVSAQHQTPQRQGGGGADQRQRAAEMKAQMDEQRRAYYADADTADYGVRYRFRYLYNKAQNLRYEEDRVVLVAPDKTLEMSYEGIGEVRWRQEHPDRKGNDPSLAYHLTPSYFFYYPGEQRLAATYRILADEFEVSDGKVENDWKLTEETKKIGDYQCRKATLDKGGRQWTAWYTRDLQGVAAPEDFVGLDGVILELSDSDNEVCWAFNGIVNNTDQSPLFILFPKKLHRRPADEFRKIKRLFALSADNYLQSSGVYDKDKAYYPEKYRPSTGIDALNSDNPIRRD